MYYFNIILSLIKIIFKLINVNMEFFLIIYDRLINEVYYQFIGDITDL